MTRRKLLVVDGVKAERAMLVQMLNTEEYEALEAGSVSEALSILSANAESLSAVIVDLAMPGEAGYTLLTTISKSPEWERIPLIVMLDSFDEATLERALSLGAMSFTVKPSSPSVLLHALRNSIRLRETASMINAFRYDTLTGLLSREAFFDEAEKRIKAEKPGCYTISSIDIDNFKVINDQFGMEVGDAVLKRVAGAVKACAEALGGLCCRFMADRFALLYPTKLTSSSAIVEAGKSRECPECANRAIRLRIGRYVADDISLPVSAMFDYATLAEESIRGRYDENIAVYDESMLKRLLNEQQLVNDIPRALSSNEFEVWYQPQYDHGSAALIGAEALVRWRHPVRGLIPPDEFIPLFERDGFICELDKYVLERTLAALRDWKERGLNPLPVSVNISRADVLADDLISTIERLVAQYSIEKPLIRFEITESAFSKSAVRIISTVKELIGLGYTVEIDDFGSGYSSLNTLKDVPAQILKLDMKFLGDGSASERSGNILESIVHMARWLDMTVIAEGVETTAQADYLRTVGCSLVQGYLYSRPIERTEYETLLSSAPREKEVGRLTTLATLDNSAFWNPASIDSLIFNSYVGSACIIEYDETRAEIIRINDTFRRELEPYRHTLIKSGFIDPGASAGAALIGAIREAVGSACERVTELHFDKDAQNGGEKDFDAAFGAFFRCTVREVTHVDKRHLIYAVLYDITDMRTAELREREADGQLRFLNAMANKLLAKSDAASCISEALNDLLTYFEGDRAYIFELDFSQNTASNTYEVVKSGIVREKDNLQDLPLHVMDFWLHVFDRGNIISIADVNAIGDDRAEERETLLAQGIRSLIAAPLRRDGALIGFIGVDNATLAYAEVGNLEAIGDYMAVLLTRRDLSEKLESDSRSISAIMDGIPGGFARLALKSDNSVVPLYFSDSFLELMELDRARLSEITSRIDGSPLLVGVHPEDQKTLAATIEKLIREGSATSPVFRLLDGNGVYKYLSFTARVRRTESGEAFINLYYLDASESAHYEQKRNALLDNLPCGAGMYEFDGTTFTVLHLNRRYLELVGRTVEESARRAVTAYVHKEDLHLLFDEIKAAIENERDISVIARIECGHGRGYRSFHIMGTLVPKESGIYTVYAAYIPLADDIMSSHGVLSAALSAVIDSSDDMVFIKDSELRYVNCNNAFAYANGADDKSELIGKTDEDIVDSEFVEAYRSADMSVISGREKKLDYEVTMRLGDGSLHQTETSKYPLMDANGNVIGIYGVAHDVTHIRETESRLKFITDSISGGLATCVISPSGIKMLYVNEGFYRFSHYTREEFDALTEKDVFFLALDEDRPILDAAIKRLSECAPSESTSCTIRCRKKEGGFRYFMLNGTVADKSGDSFTVNILTFDITEQKETEAHLRMRDEEYRLATEHSGTVICRYDIATKTLDISAEAAKRLNLPSVIHDVPEAPIANGIVAANTAEAYASFYRDIASGKKAGAARYRRLLNGSWPWIEARSSTIFSDDGKPISAVVSFRNVTEQYEKEAIYEKWQQSLADKADNTYTLFTIDLDRGVASETTDGTLLDTAGLPPRTRSTGEVAHTPPQGYIPTTASNTSRLSPRTRSGRTILSGGT